MRLDLKPIEQIYRKYSFLDLPAATQATSTRVTRGVRVPAAPTVSEEELFYDVPGDRQPLRSGKALAQTSLFLQSLSSSSVALHIADWADATELEWEAATGVAAAEPFRFSQRGAAISNQHAASQAAKRQLRWDRVRKESVAQLCSASARDHSTDAGAAATTRDGPRAASRCAIGILPPVRGN